MSQENTNFKRIKRERRKLRIRARVKGTAENPRLSVFRSNAHIYAQLIDDAASKTLANASDTELKAKKQKSGKQEAGRKIAIARDLGILVAEKAKKLGIKRVVFDRGGVKYHGRTKAVADGAREGGLKF